MCLNYTKHVPPSSPQLPLLVCTESSCCFCDCPEWCKCCGYLEKVTECPCCCPWLFASFVAVWLCTNAATFSPCILRLAMGRGSMMLWVPIGYSRATTDVLPTLWYTVECSAKTRPDTEQNSEVENRMLEVEATKHISTSRLPSSR